MSRSIRGRAVFAQLRSDGLRVRSGAVRMTFCPSPDPDPALAFAFGRKFGNAVERNRARRRLRAAFDETWDPARGPHGAYLVSGNRSVLTDEYQRLLASVEDCRDQLRRRLADQHEVGSSELAHADTNELETSSPARGNAS